jgi:hypothetical protein
MILYLRVYLLIQNGKSCVKLKLIASKIYANSIIMSAAAQQSNLSYRILEKARIKALKSEYSPSKFRDELQAAVRAKFNGRDAYRL